MCNWDEDSLTMAVAAARDALKGFDKSQIDALYLASTTLPFLDRENAGIMREALNLSNQLTTADFASSQKAGTSAVIAALDAVGSGNKDNILVVASDGRRARAASSQEMLFGDGASALSVGKGNLIADFLGSFSVSYDFVDHYRGRDELFDYNWEERWVRDEGYMKIYPEVIQGLLTKTGSHIADISRLIYPCFLKRAHAEVARTIGAKPEQISDNLNEQIGECGTAHPLIMLVRELENAKPGDKLLVAGFGQGANALLFQVTDHINNLPARKAVSGHLELRQEVKDYTKFLRFRDLLPTETGIRGEAPKQTALSSLWRDRKLVLGFLGGRCRECGTLQIPKGRICVKPGCGAVDSQDDFEFADLKGRISTFTADMLAVSLDPPAIYGMIDFDGGGRMLMNFTDCTLEEVEVGVPVELSFRKKYYDDQRSFTGYFWKAIPQRFESH
jgi:3-hydroxy-3-methylglutaryl CoA synthase